MWFSFSFLWWLAILRIYSCACWSSIYLVKKKVYSDYLPIFKNWGLFVLILSCTSWLYILCINPSLVVSFANIVSHSLSCLFILETFPFAVWKVLFNWSHLAFVLVCLLLFLLLWEGDPKKYCSVYVKEYSTCFLLGNLWFLILHFWLNGLQSFWVHFCICMIKMS